MDRVIKHGEIIPLGKRSEISARYKRITKAINRAFWNSDSDTTHSFYVGSYGRGTAVDTSDIDILIELPRKEYERYDSYNSNGQSKLLQAVKDAVLKTYPNSSVHADGQVVVVDFSDEIKFELLPAFRKTDWLGNEIEGYEYPDANMGGKWLSTNPKAEQEAMKRKNEESNGLLFDTCKHIRQIRDTYFKTYHLSGIVIDSYVYQHINDWHWLRDGEKESNVPVGSYEKKLKEEVPILFYTLYSPGSNSPIDASNDLACLRKVLNYISKD